MMPTQETLEARDMTLSTGKPVWYLHPERTPLDLNDFRTPLENICRYNGGLRWHLIRHLALGVLLCRVRFGTDNLARNIAGYYAAHDLHECVVGDMVSGMKKYVPGYQRIEDSWELHVHEQIGLPLELSISPRAVRELDLLALVVEMTRLDHPAQDIARINTGLTPSEAELHCFDHVMNMSDSECWATIVEALETAREELPWQR
jgi:hypothetical protein